MFKEGAALFAFLAILAGTGAWKSCRDVPFCSRIRHNVPDHRYYLQSAEITKTAVRGELTTSFGENARVKVTVTSLKSDTFRVLIDDVSPTSPPRHRVPEALDGQPEESPSTAEESDEKITLRNGNAAAFIYKSPFKIEFYHQDILVSVLNENHRLVFEQDSPNRAVALDVRFPRAQRAYGLPERAERLALRSTKNQDPYRHFNVDYPVYKLESTESLYGSIPVLYAHSNRHSSGIFWLNSAQTFVELDDGNREINAFFMSETGVVDLFVLTGPTLPDAVKQYAKLTGVAKLPAYFALAYHQSRYSYMTQDEVKDVAAKFDENGMPLDVLWLDIDYTLGKKYFTWDPVRFSDPVGLQNHLTESGRRLVAIIDPHIKNETGYFVHDQAVANNYYVKNPDGSDYVGDCWPGPSSYLDFTNKKTLDYYSSLYETLNTFRSKDVHIWNDMNEPAVFYKNHQDENAYEKTMPLDLVHFNKYEHRDVHNVYGFLQTIGTHKGMLDRPNYDGRPFILTRSHFAGVQRYAAVWTGDNYASWGFLKISIPMCLTEALAGVSFCGADVGGFSGIPDEELYQRWYQAGAWLPFYRGHSAIDVPRREPYMYPEAIRERLRKALNQRYVHLPLWYTAFYVHERTGEPVIRPITYQYPEETEAFSLDAQFLVGTDVLVAPILDPNTSQLNVYLPGGPDAFWYNLDEHLSLYKGTGYHLLKVDIDSVPVFYRGGSIIYRKDTLRSSSAKTYRDSFTLYIMPDNNGEARGLNYVDDYETRHYQLSRKNYVYTEVTLGADRIETKVLDSSSYSNAAIVSKIVMVNPSKNKYQNALLRTKDHNSNVDVSHSEDGYILTLTNLAIELHKPSSIELVKCK